MNRKGIFVVPYFGHVSIHAFIWPATIHIQCLYMCTMYRQMYLTKQAPTLFLGNFSVSMWTLQLGILSISVDTEGVHFIFHLSHTILVYRSFGRFYVLLVKQNVCRRTLSCPPKILLAAQEFAAESLQPTHSQCFGGITKNYFFFLYTFRFFFVYTVYLCRPSEASTQYCVIPGGYPPRG
jgi:hypothetical protein